MVEERTIRIIRASLSFWKGRSRYVGVRERAVLVLVEGQDRKRLEALDMTWVVPKRKKSLLWGSGFRH